MHMAYQLKTQTITAQTISNEEVQKANTAFSDLEVAQAGLTTAQQTIVDKNTQLVQKDSLIAQKDARIRELEALIPAPPVPVPPTPVPPTPVPSTNKTGLYVDGGTLRTKNGSPVVIRGIEMMYGPTSVSNTTTVINNIKNFGANALGPLFQSGNPSSDAAVQNCINIARSKGLIVGVNADHTGDGRNWIKKQSIVQMCNAADNVFLQCEVEQGDDSNAIQWRDASIAFVKALRDAGHKSPIKVGSPLGGRLPHFALQQGKAVVDADPLKSVIFTCQMYWKNHTNGWQFSNEAGFSSGTPGALEACDAMRASGLCFIVGLDGKDDIGETPYVEIANRLHQHGIGWQYWALMVGDSYGNGIVADTLSTTPKMPYGPTVVGLLKTQSVLANL